MNNFDYTSIILFVISILYGGSAVYKSRKVLSRQENIVKLQKARHQHVFGILAFVLLGILYALYRIPARLTTFVVLMGMILLFTGFSYFYKDLVAFFSDKVLFINEKEIPYRNIQYFSVAKEDSRFPRVTFRYKRFDERKQKEMLEESTVEIEKEVLSSLLQKLKQEKVKRQTVK